MEIKEIMKLIQAVSDYSLTSFELEEGDMKISLTREKEVVGTPAVTGSAEVMAALAGAGMLAGNGAGAAAGNVLAGAVGAGMAAGIGTAGSVPGESGTAVGQTAEIASDKVVTSPLVGTFYSSSSPDAESFVKVGDRVKKGQVLGIIEAMKLMNEIESEYDGVVEAILVNNEDVVEYGQPLFRIGA